MTKLEFVSYDSSSRKHGWKCEACELYHWCEDEYCPSCDELSPFIDDHCPGCYDEFEGNRYLARIYK